MEHAYRNNQSGFTLIEFLVAIVIMMVGLLGLLQSVNVALQQNMTTQLRNEATLIADEQMAREMSKGFDLVDTTTLTSGVQRQILKGFKNFSVTRTGSSFANSKQVNYEVRWTHRNNRYSHTMYGVSTKSK